MNTTESISTYDTLIPKIFSKSSLPSSLSTLKTAVTTATYSSDNFNDILKGILEEESMISSLAKGARPTVAVSVKLSSNPTKLGEDGFLRTMYKITSFVYLNNLSP